MIWGLICFSVFFSNGIFAEDDASASPNPNLTGFEARDESQPLWEFGVGGGAIEVPNYPASSECNFIAIALSCLIDRGNVFRVGGGGSAQTVVVEKSNFDIYLSFVGGFSAYSEDKSARAGMPELDFLFEVRPQLIYKIEDFDFNNGGTSPLNACFQARAIFATDFEHINQRSYVFEPMLAYQQRGYCPSFTLTDKIYYKVA